MGSKRLLQTREVAEHLGLGRDRVSGLVVQGAFPGAVKNHLSSRWLIPEEDVERYETLHPRRTKRASASIPAAFLQTREVAGRLGLGTGRVASLIAQGAFPGAVKDDTGRRWLIPDQDVELRLGEHPRATPRSRTSVPESFLQTRDVAESLGLGPGRVAVLVARGAFPGAIKNETGTRWLIPQGDLERYLREHPPGTPRMRRVPRQPKRAATRTTMSPGMIGTREASERLHITSAWVAALVKRGVFLGATKNAGGTRWMIPRRRVEEFARTYSPSERANLRRNWSRLHPAVFNRANREAQKRD